MRIGAYKHKIFHFIFNLMSAARDYYVCILDSYRRVPLLNLDFMPIGYHSNQK